jgi:hypothetical protein
VHRADEHHDTYMEEPEEVLIYRDIITRLTSVSLDADQSRTMITKVITTSWT